MRGRRLASRLVARCRNTWIKYFRTYHSSGVTCRNWRRKHLPRGYTTNIKANTVLQLCLQRWRQRRTGPNVTIVPTVDEPPNSERKFLEVRIFMFFFFGFVLMVYTKFQRTIDQSGGCVETAPFISKVRQNVRQRIMETLKLINVGFVVDVVVLKHVSLLALRFSPSSYHSINAPYLSSIRCCYVSHISGRSTKEFCFSHCCN
jgi:hypothetical protein